MAALPALATLALLPGCGSGHNGAALVVASTDDSPTSVPGKLTLRAAIDQAGPGDRITFDRSIDGATITLTTVGSEHAQLPGETYAGMTFQGYQDRDYGRSALYARKPLDIDASGLQHGIRLKWGGGDGLRARVLTVYGDLTMRNVTVTSGHSSAEAIAGGAQPFTLARGGGLAVWGTARLDRCTIAGNRCTGDTVSSRDRGTYGGGIYANGLQLTNCIISGNASEGYGAAGGGVYSVGGADGQNGRGLDTSLTGCVVTGNRVTAQHAYGGGVFTLSGGPSNLATMTLTNCTVARNLVEDNPALPEAGQFYYRGGGIYMGGGSLALVSCTVAENEVNGHLATFSGKPNMAGGGITATIGNAHVVEVLSLRHSIVAGNKVNGAADDCAAGSLLNFYSQGYNLLGAVDFQQILVPVPEWMNLSRKHYPKAGDQDAVAVTQVLDVAGAQRDPTILSAGTDSGQTALLWYPPAGLAVDRIPSRPYAVSCVYAGYSGYGDPTDDFLNRVVDQLRRDYGTRLGAGFGAAFGDLTGITWYGPRVTWPSEPTNQQWIQFWHNLDAEIGSRLGTVGLGDDFWGTFVGGPQGPHVRLTVQTSSAAYTLINQDQRGVSRRFGRLGDVGAIER